MKLYFVRHGESEANTRHIISNRERLLGLTSLGREKAKALAKSLSDISFSAIFCSRVLRARETAAMLSVALNTPYQLTEALREYDCGILEDQSDAESWRLHREYFDDWTLRHNYRNKPEGGESFLDIQDRFLPFIELLKAGADRHILLIGHGGLLHLMLPLVLTNIDDVFVSVYGMDHTECVIAELCSDKFFCKQWGNIQF